MRRALVICGPTASGKSRIALSVAQVLDGELVNADSRQIYHEMPIGTNLPPASDLERVPHHLYAFVDPAERYSAGRFVEDARRVIGEICDRRRVPIVTGGTGFYIETLMGTMRLDRPPADEALRSRLHEEARTHPPEMLWEWLRVLSPLVAKGIRPTDSYRILRGLEAAMARKTLGPSKTVTPPDIEFAVVMLRLPKSQLRGRIARRTQKMYAAGLVREAQAIREIAPHAPALSGLGYAEALALYDGRATEAEAIAKTVARTERYAKRQETWFRHMHADRVVDAEPEPVAVDNIVSLARERLITA